MYRCWRLFWKQQLTCHSPAVTVDCSGNNKRHEKASCKARLQAYAGKKPPPRCTSSNSPKLSMYLYNTTPNKTRQCYSMYAHSIIDFGDVLEAQDNQQSG